MSFPKKKRKQETKQKCKKKQKITKKNHARSVAPKRGQLPFKKNYLLFFYKNKRKVN